MSPIGSFLQWIRERITRMRFTPNRTIVDRTLVSSPATPRSPATCQYDRVTAIARTLEAQLIMGEGMMPGQMFMLEVEHESLAHFVCYMRQLQSDYELASLRVAALEKEITNLTLPQYSESRARLRRSGIDKAMHMENHV